jgi:hypothetical protein
MCRERIDNDARRRLGRPLANARPQALVFAVLEHAISSGRVGLEQATQARSAGTVIANPSGSPLDSGHRWHSSVQEPWPVGASSVPCELRCCAEEDRVESSRPAPFGRAAIRGRGHCPERGHEAHRPQDRERLSPVRDRQRPGTPRGRGYAFPRRQWAQSPCDQGARSRGRSG